MTVTLPQTIAANIDRFTGRTWVLPPLLDWLERSDRRTFLLTGGPGTGKSMILAWLAGAGPTPSDPAAAEQLALLRSQVAAAHFCVAGSRDNSPLAFAQNVAGQLTTSVQGFDDALQATLKETLAGRMQIAVTQTIGTIQPGGRATGVSIDLDGLGDELGFDRALTGPLKKLYESGYDAPLLLLVDALDEAETYTGTKLPLLLAGLDGLPGQVRLVATTRGDPRIVKYYRDSLHLDLIEDAPPDVDDVRSYAAGRLARVDGLDTSTASALADDIAAAAKGIFLYAALVLDDLLARVPSLAGVGPASYPLPDGLSGLYGDFLNCELGQDEDRWYGSFRPVLGLISVARGDGLTRTQLAAITGKEVDQPLRICKQYLSGELPEGPFGVFHKSFADYLLDDDRNVDYCIDASAMHRLIAGHFLQVYTGRWQQCSDRYALAYTAAHLAGSVRQVKEPLRRDEQRQKLASLLGEWSFLEAKAGQLGIDDLLADLRSATALEKTRPGAPLDLGDLLAVLEQEQPNLVGWNEAVRPAFFAQQILNRSVDMSLPALARAAKARLQELGYPYLELCWRAGPPARDRARYGFSALWNRDTVSGLVATPDGRKAVSAHLDATLKVWDLATGQKIRTLTGHEAIVLAVAVTPDGLRAVSGSQDNTLKVWDLETGRVLRTLPSGEGTVFTVRVTPDGRRAVSRADDGLLRVWDLRSGRELHSLGEPKPPYYFTFAMEEDWIEYELPDLLFGISEYALAVTAGGRRAISASSGGYQAGDVLKVWDLETGLEIYSLPGHSDQVVSVAASPDGRWAVSASDDHTVRVWDLETGRLAHTLTGHYDGVQAVLVTRDSRLVVSASLDETVKVWDLRTGRLLQELTGPGGLLYALALSPDGRCVISADFEGVLTVWSLQSGQELAHVSLAGGRPQLASVQQGDVILAGTSDGNVYCLRYVEPDRPGA
jgi:WD40 repeat protein